MDIHSILEIAALLCFVGSYFRSKKIGSRFEGVFFPMGALLLIADVLLNNHII
ncbi:MAG: hypothetical protein LKJ83_08600 [Eubacteriaceae bacterium]|jgi:hypothetical protein|nr:hypothetical protein [Eubacteriaceae bacterium]